MHHRDYSKHYQIALSKATDPRPCPGFLGPNQVIGTRDCRRRTVLEPIDEHRRVVALPALRLVTVRAGATVALAPAAQTLQFVTLGGKVHRQAQRDSVR